MVGKAMQQQPKALHSRRDFHFELPSAQIASEPSKVRDQSRLLQLTPTTISHLRFDALPELLQPGDLLVLNNTRVVKARLKASKDSGGSAELLLERIETPTSGLFQVRVSKALKAGRWLQLDDGSKVEVLARVGQFYRLGFSEDIMPLLDRLGSVPLPPYIERDAEAVDEQRYQTVYGKEPGAAAAPTAGLHFTHELLDRLRQVGIRILEITLHVGAGTFQPVRVDDIRDHEMHAERYYLSAEAAAAVAQTRREGGRIVAVGTTVIRALESAAVETSAEELKTGWQETRIFITPGFRFRVVDALITNFHLPESTLLMLVSAFAGYDRVMHAYQVAVREGYRFFSYGDAMFVERSDDV